MQKFSIDPARLSRYREAADAGFAAARNAQDDVLAARERKAQIVAEREGLRSRGISTEKGEAAELIAARLAEADAEISKLNDICGRAGEVAQHHGGIRTLINDYAGHPDGSRIGVSLARGFSL